MDYGINVATFEIDGKGTYRYRIEEIVNDGVRETSQEMNQYIEWELADSTFIDIFTQKQLLLAGIDPQEEAKLVGLDEAIVNLDSSRYFSLEDQAEQIRFEHEADSYLTVIPVLMNNQSYTNQKVIHTLEKLNFESYDTVPTNLDEVEGELTESMTVTDEDAFYQIANNISNINIKTGEKLEEDEKVPFDFHYLYSRPGMLSYKQVESPYSERWPSAFELQKLDYTNSFGERIESFREPSDFDLDHNADAPMIRLDWIGFYDPALLDISMDVTNELPMETYRPARAELVLDSELNPVNPPRLLEPTNYSLYLSLNQFLAEPPILLTTLDAAEAITGQAPISAIRIKVEGVTDLSSDSQNLLEQVSQEIEDQTGLITDITLGSSPQPTLVNVPAINEHDELGWFEQSWINIGSSMTIFNETKIGYSGLMITVMAVAIIYVWSSNLVSLLSRRKEYAVLLATGWRPNQINKLFIFESVILGTFVTIISISILSYINLTENVSIDFQQFILIGLFAFLVYLLGAIFPIVYSRHIVPYEAMRTGEISKTNRRFILTRGIVSMAANHFFKTWKRNSLSILAIALPTSLLAVFLIITIRFQGILYLTYIGQFIAFEVGVVQYTAIIVALIIAILTTAEIMWQNIADRKEEVALLKAVAWRNRHIRYLIWFEGLIIGLIAAIIALIIAFTITWVLYQQIPTEHLSFILLTGFIPLIVGVLGTIIPAERAVRMSPIKGLNRAS